MENSYPKVAIMGGGSFATAIAKIVMENVPNIIWYMRRDDQIAEFKRVGHNPSYLSAVSFDLDRIKFTSKINVAVAEADILFFATPSPFLKSHLKKLRRKIDNKIMKYNKEKLEQHIEELSNMTIYVGDEIVWEGQCGQADHFDKLSKPEQIALVDIFAKMKGLKESLIVYQSWFENTKLDKIC